MGLAATRNFDASDDIQTIYRVSVCLIYFVLTGCDSSRVSILFSADSLCLVGGSAGSLFMIVTMLFKM